MWNQSPSAAQRSVKVSLPDVVSQDRVLKVGPDGRTNIRVVRPAGATGMVPVVIYIHGGGWIQGSAANLGHDMRWFADRGYLVVSVDYRLATASQSS